MSASQADEISTPTLDARRGWDDRYGALTPSVRNWHVAFALTTVCSLVLVIGFVLRNLQHKVLPAVLHVDEHGLALAMGPLMAEDGATLADERLIRSQLADFVRSARRVLTDRTTLTNQLGQGYAPAWVQPWACPLTTAAASGVEGACHEPRYREGINYERC